MYNVNRLTRVALAGLRDMFPALRHAFSGPDAFERLVPIYGPSPLAVLIGLPLILAVVGEWFSRFGPDFKFKEHVDWAAVFVAVPLALLIRRFLFHSADNERRPSDKDFPWIAASLIPPMLICLMISIAAIVVLGPVTSGLDEKYRTTGLGQFLMIATSELGVIAALTIALAALCFSREWIRAATDLAVRLLVFRILIWVTALVLIEIGIVGQLIGGLVHAVTGWTLPGWVKVLTDQISYAVLLTIAYLAIIGGTWTVCRRSFSGLLETGHVDVVAEIEKLANKKPETSEKTKETSPP